MPFATIFGPHPFTGPDWLAAGHNRDQLRALVAKTLVRRVVQGVYVDTAVPDTLDLRAQAVSRVLPAGRVVCGRTAAWLWGVDALAMGAHRVLPAVDVLGMPGSAAHRRSGTCGTTGPLPPEDVVTLGGVCVTVPARTAADLARLLGRADALAAVDALVRVCRTAPEDITQVLDRFTGYRGVVQARELALLADGRSESPQESRMRLRCIDAGFPAPEPQIEVFDIDGSFVARLDLGWRDVRKGVEFDGDEHHSTVVDQRRDRARRERVERCGWAVAVITAEQLLSRSLAFENCIAAVLEKGFTLSRHHPRYGGWDARSRWAA